MTMMNPIISTIGYEGAGVEDVVRTLREAGIKTLLDIRAVAWSRKPGFGADDLRIALPAAGIAYVHIAALGNPQKRTGRPEGDTRSYEDMYNDHLDTDIARAALARAAQMAKDASACLMCFEADPRTCHRRLTAARMVRDYGFDIRDLYVERKTDQLALF